MSLKRLWEQYGPAVVIFVAVMLTWEFGVRIFEVERFILPAPSAIATNFVENFDRLVHIGWFTTKEALGGFAIGSIAGILTALLTARYILLRETLMPFAIAANSIPILAFAPIINNWFGIDNPVAKMVIVAIIIYFPMMINTMRGLTSVDPAALELMRSYAASEFDILTKLRIPNALPFIFSGFKVAAALSMIGAVVSEFFGGNRSALGVFITQEAALFRFENSWSAIIIACIVGITFYLVILLVERFSIPWHVSFRNSG